MNDKRETINVFTKLMFSQKTINFQKFLLITSFQIIQLYKKRLSKPFITKTRIILKSIFFNDIKLITNDAHEKSVINIILFYNNEKS